MVIRLTEALVKSVGAYSLISYAAPYIPGKQWLNRFVPFDATTGGKVLVGIHLIATVCEGLYQKYRGEIKSGPSFVCYSLGVAGMIVVCGAKKINFPVLAMVGLAALSYFMSRVPKEDPIKCDEIPFPKICKRLSLKPEHNIYLEADQEQISFDSLKWKKAEGEFSLQGLAELFSRHFSFHRLFSLKQPCKRMPEAFIKQSVGQNGAVNTDDMLGSCFEAGSDKFKIFSMADEFEYAEESCLVGRAVNQGFVGYFNAMFEKSDLSMSASELTRQLVLAVGAAQEKALLVKRADGEVNSGNPTHLGLIAYIDCEKKAVYCQFTSVGNCKLLAKFPDGTLVDLTQDIDHLEYDDMFVDAGGKLGRVYPKNGSDIHEIPDLRNMTVGGVILPIGTVLIPMTDGMYDNFDPKQLGLKPDEAYQELYEGALGISRWRTGAGREIRNQYLTTKIKETLGEKTGQEAVNALVDAAQQQVSDAMSCAWIELS